MKFIAFWSYDIFPFCLWGELTKADKTHFWVKGFDGYKFSNKSKIAFLPEAQAEDVIAKLEKMTADKKTADNRFKREASKLLESL